MFLNEKVTSNFAFLTKLLDNKDTIFITFMLFLCDILF